MVSPPVGGDVVLRLHVQSELVEVGALGPQVAGGALLHSAVGAVRHIGGQALGGEDGASAAIRASTQLGDAQSTIAKQELLIDNLRAECKTLQEKLKQKDKKRSKRKG